MKPIAEQTVSAFEAKTHLSQLLVEAEKGRCITITRRGKPVARLVPIAEHPDAQGVEALLSEFREIRAKIKGPVDVLALAREGRKY